MAGKKQKKFQWTPQAFAKTLRDDIIDAGTAMQGFISEENTWHLVEVEKRLHNVLTGIETIKKELAKR